MDDPVCNNNSCEFYDEAAHQGCGGDRDGEPAIASCKVYDLDRSNGLLPCPFCGGDADFGVSDIPAHDNGQYIQCQMCLASTCLVYPLMEDAKPSLREKWNRRKR